MNNQAIRLKDHFESGKTITRLTALTDLGIFELSSRVIQLEKQGMEIKRKWVKVTNRWNETIRVKEYWTEGL